MIDTVRPMKITVIPAKEAAVESADLKERNLRMAAYCRVSTDSEEQINSYNAQKAYYTKLITENPNWELVGIFADEGITGTSMKKRDEFNRMLSYCKRGRIDMILVKSLSRFARNTVDCLDTTRMLRSRGIGVIFEKENINTLTESSEFMITLFSSFAQAESESLSKNVTWGIRKNMEAGKVPIQYKKLLGYQKGQDGLPEIVPEEAETVKQIFRWYLDGCSLCTIRQRLEEAGMTTASGSTTWSQATVLSILTNEKYAGDALLQKTYTLDCINKVRRKNNGELPMIYIENHHDAIISRPVFQWVQEEMSRRTSKRRVADKSVKTEQGKFSSKYALSERLVCGECGSAYRRCTWTSRGKRRIVWRCISRLEYGKQYCHDSPTLREDALHAAILEAINGYIDQKKVKSKAREISEMVILGSSTEGMDISALQNQVAEITAEQERLLDLILEDMDNPDLNSRMQTLTDQKALLLSDIDNKKAELTRHEADLLRMKDVDAWMREHPVGFQTYDDTVTRKLVERVTAIDSSTIRVKFYGDEEETTVRIPE